MFNLSDIDSYINSLTIDSTDISELQSSIALDSLPQFYRQAWDLIEPETQFSWNWHLEEMSNVCSEIETGNLRRVIFNIPPGCSKSILVNVMFPARLWAKNPSLRFLTASYSDVNTIRDNRRVRDIVTSPWFKSISPQFQLASDQTAKVRFDTTRKGWRIATSVGGMGTGEHPDYIIIDDPLKADDSRSDVAMENVNSWFDNTISTRVARNPAIIIIMQRLHINDLSAHLVKKGGFELISFPMRYVTQDEIDIDKEKNKEQYEDNSYALQRRADSRDHRTESGELLWPSQWDEEKTYQAEIILGPFGSASQFQQWPIPEGGGLFEWDWFDIVDCLPNSTRLYSCRGWDTADTEVSFTKKGKVSSKGDWTIGVKLTVDRKTGIYYVEHVIREKARSLTVDNLIKSTAKLDGVKVKIREGEGSGKSTTAKRAVELAGYDYGISPEKEDKVLRAGPFRTQCQARNVKLVRGEWNQAYLSVLTSFPVGRYDDDVDASSNAFNELAVNVKKKAKLTW